VADSASYFCFPVQYLFAHDVIFCAYVSKLMEMFFVIIIFIAYFLSAINAYFYLGDYMGI